MNIYFIKSRHRINRIKVNMCPSFSDLGSDLEKKTERLLDQISGLKSPSSSMGTVSKVSTVEERKVEDYPSPTEFPEKEEDYDWRRSKISISGKTFLLAVNLG